MDALAASTPLTTTSLGSGVATVSACQSGPIVVSFGATAQGEVRNVTLRNIDSSSCAGGTLRVSLNGAHGEMLAEATATVPSSGDELSIPVRATDAAAIDGVHVSLTT